MFFKTLAEARRALRSSHYGPPKSELRKQHWIVPCRQTSTLPESEWPGGFTIVLKLQKAAK